jgi:ribulose-5-phosphate 4-epimerase/fuculose-1-phosphate aldolase
MRVPEATDRFVVKGRGYEIDALSSMTPDDMIVCDLEGNKVEGPPDATQCFEVKMHSCVYRTYPEVQSVVHVHPRFVVVMSVLQAPLVPMCQEGVHLVREPLPFYPHLKTIESDEEGMEVALLLGSSKAIILEGHGATTTGASLEEAVLNMLQLEEQARMNWYAYCAGGPAHRQIPPETIDDMTSRPSVYDLPHFKDGPGPRAGSVDGVWAHFTRLVQAAM